MDNAAQYEHVRKLLQCGHAYAKIEDYASALEYALRKMSQEGTDADSDSWMKVCVIIGELGFITFGQRWQAVRLACWSSFSEEIGT